MRRKVEPKRIQEKNVDYLQSNLHFTVPYAAAGRPSVCIARTVVFITVIKERVMLCFGISLRDYSFINSRVSFP